MDEFAAPAQIKSLVSNSFCVTSSKALVTTSVALVFSNNVSLLRS